MMCRAGAIGCRRAIGPLLMVVLVAIVAIAAPRAFAQSLPANGDFARGGVPPAGWNIEALARPKGSMAFVPAPAGIAGQVLALSPNSANTPSDQPYGIGQLLPAATLRGREVVVSGLLGASGGATAVLGVVVLTGRGPAASVQIRADGALARREDRVVVPDAADIVGIVLFLVAEGQTGTARFGAISVRPATGNAASNSATPRGDAPSAMSATVHVDASRILHTIPRAIFGTNLEVIQDGQGLWDVRNRRLQPQIVALARDLALGPIRFPGGVWSDAYDWRLGLGPQDKRPSQPVVPGADWSYRHSFGTDEALAFARAVGSNLMMTVNVGNGTPELAADWVRYVNGEGGRAPRGPRVELWEIGNELYMEGDASGGHLTPEAYAEKLLAFAAAMKAVDPTIRLGAIGLRNFGRYRFNSFDNWNEVVLRRAGHAFDLLNVHNAYAPVVADGAALDPVEVYKALWAFPQLVARNLQDTWREVEQFAPAHAARIRLGVTEWGPLYDINPKSPWIHHVRTLGSAVYVASILKVFAENPHVGLANFFKLNEPSFMGWIGKRGSEWLPTAPYKAFRLISRTMETGLLRARVEVPTYNSVAMGLVEQVSGVPYLDALATASDDRGRLAVLLINKSADAAIDTRVALGGIAGATTLAIETLTGAAPDANTGTELLKLPGLDWGAQRAVGPQGRINHGGPGEIRVERTERAIQGRDVAVRVPPHSVMVLRLGGVKPP